MGLQGERALQMDVQDGSRLQLQAFEAINEVVRSASPDTLPLVGQLIQALLDKLASTLRMQVASSEAKEHQKDLQVQCLNTPTRQTFYACTLQLLLIPLVVGVISAVATRLTEDTTKMSYLLWHGFCAWLSICFRSRLTQPVFHDSLLETDRPIPN